MASALPTNDFYNPVNKIRFTDGCRNMDETKQEPIPFKNVIKSPACQHTLTLN